MWSSGENTAAQAYYLTFTTTDVRPQYSAWRYDGFPVRCIELKDKFRTATGVYAGNGGTTGTLSRQGERSYTWSSGESTAANAYYLHFITTEVRPQWSNNKDSGFPVRCIELKNKFRTATCVYTGHSGASGALTAQGSQGRAWSSGENAAAQAYRLYFVSSEIQPQGSSNKSNGFSVRCIELKEKFRTATCVYAGRSQATGTLQLQGSQDFVWSSDEVSATNARDLYFTTAEVNPQPSGANKNHGLSVRCIELSKKC